MGPYVSEGEMQRRGANYEELASKIKHSNSTHDDGRYP